jgi:hypothetical protein
VEVTKAWANDEVPSVFGLDMSARSGGLHFTSDPIKAATAKEDFRRINANNSAHFNLTSSIPNMATREFRHLIEDLEEETWRVLQKSDSGSAIMPYLAPDCVMQFPLGVKVSRDTVPSVRDILHSPGFVPWKSYRMSKIDVTPVGKDGAVVSYLVQATRVAADPKDEDVTFEALCSSVWRMSDDGEFKMCFHQQSLTT